MKVGQFQRQAKGLVLGVLLAVLSGCGGGGGGGGGGNSFPPLNNPLLQPTALCTALHFNALARFVEQMQGLFDFFNGAAIPVGVTQVSATEYTIKLDLDLDGATDVTVDMVLLASSFDISDGMQVGEQIDFSLIFRGDINGSSPFVSFSYVAINPPFLSLRGGFFLADLANCGMSAPNFVISWDPGNLDSASPNFQFSVTVDQSTFNGQLFPDQDSDFLLVFGQLDGVDNGFAIDPDTFDVFED